MTRPMQHQTKALKQKKEIYIKAELINSQITERLSLTENLFTLEEKSMR